jgi:RecA/RadA recombinase
VNFATGDVAKMVRKAQDESKDPISVIIILSMSSGRLEILSIPAGRIVDIFKYGSSIFLVGHSYKTAWNLRI